ncbi:hypothetical protein SDC9_53744 [bioreactor metagenome]|uniref:Uncharacterized protein n=1 Tax=bioreactor metagenome TaxID=1076179 RepID=A0A644WVB8_9ZZZZ
MPQEFDFKFKIAAQNPEEARKIAEAINKIYKRVQPNDLIKLADAIDKKPSLIKQALMFI